MANVKLKESSTLGVESKSGELSVRLISPGWGSSGYYSPQVLENAAREKVFKKGTQMFFDHPAESERRDRPERSVRDLAAILIEDAYVSEGGALDARVNVIGPHRELLTDPTFVENIGVSIAAYADSTIGEAEGRKGTIMTALTEAVSVDFVTRAGRGGKVLAIMESARGNQSVEERSSTELHDLLERAVNDKFSNGDNYPWLVDFDPEESILWYRNNGLWQASYSFSGEDGNVVTISDDAVEVRQVATYVPLTPSRGVEESKPPVVPAGLSEETHESKEDTMPQIEEGRLAQLTEDAGRVPTLEAERDTAITRADKAEESARNATARAAALTAIIESGKTFSSLEVKGLLVELPMTESNELDKEKFDEVIAEAKPANTGSPVRQFGESHEIEESDGFSVEDFDKIWVEA